ncbi:MAG TPA: hypothetical protein VNK24_08320 [Elusimicrobiota bacterium]|nr:hypothetical protein [Elusimicrobiota bacterium]
MKATGPGATVGIALEDFGAERGAMEGSGRTGKILCFVRLGGNQEAYAKDLADLQKQNAILRGNPKSLKSLVCADHPDAAACLPGKK